VDVRPIGLFLCVIALVMAVGCGGGPRNSPNNGAETKVVPVTLSKAAMRTMTQELSATGDVRPFAEASVVSEVQGTIEQIRVERGEKIQEGEVIAVVEHAEASAGVQQAEAALQAARAQVVQAEATLKNLEIEHNRVKALFDAGVASQQMLDEISSNCDVAAAAKDTAVAQVAQAEAALRNARVFLDNHTIRAPIGGTVAVRHVDKGDKNNPAEPVVSIARIDPLKVLCDFPERDLPLLQIDQKAFLQVDAYPNEKFPATVKIISPCMDATARTVGVELWAPNPDGRLRPGMFARVTLLGDPFDAVAVPDDALTHIPGTGVQFVFVIDGDVARRVDLETGRRSGGWTEVTGDIHPEDPVVIEGHNNLRSGSKVRVVSTTGN
jgi:membrane fusion protein (multidrug efflux system)